MLSKSPVLSKFCLTLLFVAWPLIFNAHTMGGGKVINVKVLSIKGCEATPPTIDLVKSVAEELKIKIELTRIVVETSEHAKKRTVYRKSDGPN